MTATFTMSDADERRRGMAAAAAALSRGELVAVPTETVYGLAADATNPEAVAAIFTAKGRPRFNPLIVHVANVAAARELVAFTPAAERLARAFWPGPLTLVLPRRPGPPIADLVTAGLPTLAVRVPAHPVAAELLAACGLPLAAPSANRSGHVSPTTAAHVAEDLGDKVAVILDAGRTTVGLESTIVSLAGPLPALLRPGGIPRERIEAVLEATLAEPTASAAPAAPGMLASHYAPTVPLRLDADEVHAGESLLTFGRKLLPGVEQAVAAIDLSPSGDLTEAAVSLFGALRELERRGAPIAVAPIPEDGLGEAINDRLRRAAAPGGPPA